MFNVELLCVVVVIVVVVRAAPRDSPLLKQGEKKKRAKLLCSVRQFTRGVQISRVGAKQAEFVLQSCPWRRRRTGRRGVPHWERDNADLEMARHLTAKPLISADERKKEAYSDSLTGLVGVPLTCHEKTVGKVTLFQPTLHPTP